jgi:hypothetical protein
VNDRIPFPLDPEMQALSDLVRFKARAVIDWIEIEIKTVTPTNFQTVQDRLGAILDTSRRSWVDPADKAAGGAATIFAIRFHDVRAYSQLSGWIARLAVKLPLAGEPTIRAIEVAADFYSKVGNRLELEAMVLRLKHSLSAEGTKELECGPWTERLSDTRTMRADRTLVIARDGIQWRVYLKDRDNGAPIANQAAHRARVEVTVTGNQLRASLQAVDDLRTFRFEGLCRLFAFRYLQGMGPITSPTTAAEVAAQRLQMLALNRGHRELPIPPRRKHPMMTRADVELKERLRLALRELTRRVRAEKQGKNRSAVTETKGETPIALLTTTTNYYQLLTTVTYLPTNPTALSSRGWISPSLPEGPHRPLRRNAGS